MLTSDRHVEYVLLGSSVFDGECSEISMKTNRENIWMKNTQHTVYDKFNSGVLGQNVIWVKF